MSESNYMNFKHFKITSLAILLASFASGCSFLDRVAPDNTQEYRKAETMPALEVPPDLSTNNINDNVTGVKTTTATYSDFEQAAENPLASRYGVATATTVALAGKGETRHLVVPGEIEVTWQRVLDFWSDEGVDIKREDPRIGLMDTETDSDDYAYRVRIDRGNSPKTANVYLSGLGDDANAQKDEAMLRQLADFLGVLHKEEQAVVAEQQKHQVKQKVAVVTLVTEPSGASALLVEQDFVEVWDRVGRALDSKGFHVEDRDRSQGTYLIRYIDPLVEVEEDGFMDGLAFWRDDVDKSPEEFYNIKLKPEDENTRIVILDTEENRLATDSSKRLLGLLKEQLEY